MRFLTTTCLTATLSLLIACGGDVEPDPTGVDQPDNSAPQMTANNQANNVVEEPSCVAGERTVDLPDLGNATVLGVWPSTGAFLLKTKLEDGSITLDLVDETGATNLASFPDAGNYAFRAAPIEWQDSRCAVASLSTETLRLICEDGTDEASDISADGDLFPVVAGGTIHVFAQTFASYTEIVFDGAEWREINKYESSISKPTDATLHNGQPLTCFISNSDVAVLDGWGSEPSSTETASRCSVTTTSEGAHVLTESGYALVTSSMSSFTTSPLTMETRLLDLATIDDQAVVVTRGEEGLVFRALPDLDMVQTIPTGADHVYESYAHDAETGTIRTVYSSNGENVNTYVTKTTCL